MEEELISFETAKLAKEKGFNIPTRNFYADKSWEDEQVYNCGSVGYPEFTNDMGANHGFGDITLIPIQSVLQKWLREVHNIHLVIKPRFKGDLNNPIVDYSYNGEKGDRNNIFYPTYEEALEVGLQEALKLIEYGRTKSKF